MTNLSGILQQLQKERSHLSIQLDNLNNAISALGGMSHKGGYGTRGISAAGRARIAAAQRARWAKIKGRKVVSIDSSNGRSMSPAARRRIAAAQRARWVKWRRANQ
jgi:hypothetical protein